MQFEDLPIFLPAYLTVESKNALQEALKDFPKVSEDKFYTDYLKGNKVIYQGDGLNGLTFVNLISREFKSNKLGIVLSNTCDLFRENQRLFSSHMVYAPIFNLKNYSEALVKQGILRDKVDGHLDAIRRQTITQIFYLPACKGIIDESMVFFDQLNSIDSEGYSLEELDKNRAFTLSDYGHYLFLFKLSFHFTRFQDKVERRNLLTE